MLCVVDYTAVPYADFQPCFKNTGAIIVVFKAVADKAFVQGTQRRISAPWHEQANKCYGPRFIAESRPRRNQLPGIAYHSANAGGTDADLWPPQSLFGQH